MVQAVIYDMDGILIDSEPLWRRIEVKIFGDIGLPMTEAMCHETMGMRVDEVVEYWYQRFPWEGVEKKEVENRIWECIISLVKEEGVAMPGVYESLTFFKDKNLKMGLASTSAMILINTVLEKLQIKDYFEVIHSAEFEEYGKPHPGVYITAAWNLGVDPTYCVAIEDSINGIVASKAAKMKVIAIPEESLRQDKRLGIANYQLNSLNEVNGDLWQRLNT